MAAGSASPVASSRLPLAQILSETNANLASKGFKHAWVESLAEYVPVSLPYLAALRFLCYVPNAACTFISLLPYTPWIAAPITLAMMSSFERS